MITKIFLLGASTTISNMDFSLSQKLFSLPDGLIKKSDWKKEARS